MTADARQAMDQIYRRQRYIYDATRKFFLFGRDTVIANLQVRSNHAVLEMGCGTGRNLIMAARRYPQAYFYGLDAAGVMIETASQKVACGRLEGRIQLRQALAQDVHSLVKEGWPESYDVVYFSYALSMIPPWAEALEAAWVVLKPGGTLYIVDFWDQARWPGWFRRLLKGWLNSFSVHYRPELLEYLRRGAAEGRYTLELTSVMGQYAYIATLKKPAAR